jgi:hypothetical protein
VTGALAAQGGHLHVMKYLQSEGMPFDEDTYFHAAEGGHLAVLKWLRSEEVPIDIDKCMSAVRFSPQPESAKVKIIQWIQMNKYL